MSRETRWGTASRQKDKSLICSPPKSTQNNMPTRCPYPLNGDPHLGVRLIEGPLGVRQVTPLEPPAHVAKQRVGSVAVHLHLRSFRVLNRRQPRVKLADAQEVGIMPSPRHWPPRIHQHPVRRHNRLVCQAVISMVPIVHLKHDRRVLRRDGWPTVSTIRCREIFKTETHLSVSRIRHRHTLAHPKRAKNKRDTRPDAATRGVENVLPLPVTLPPFKSTAVPRDTHVRPTFFVRMMTFMYKAPPGSVA